jgi:beta-carotene 3-hydroxylase
MTDVLLPLVLVVASLIAMEGVAALAHRYVMHGWGWGWHRSHHEPRPAGAGPFEKNDLYALVFSLLSIGLFAAGSLLWQPLWWVALGITGYGLVYFLFHDVLVHRRLPLRWVPRRGYLKRLVQAHRLHHAVESKEGCVSFGFLYARPADRLRAELQAKGSLTGPG